jgi:small conductance mechanosensitive channel
MDVVDPGAADRLSSRRDSRPHPALHRPPPLRPRQAQGGRRPAQDGRLRDDRHPRQRGARRLHPRRARHRRQPSGRLQPRRGAGPRLGHRSRAHHPGRGLVLRLLARLPHSQVRREVSRQSSSSSRTLFAFLGSLVRFSAVAIGLIAALQQLNFPIASLVAIVGAAGLAIALALQDTLKAVAAGVIIAVFRPYRIGDVVQISGETGTVADITPFTTVLNTIDNKEITVTNDKAWGDVIVNHSARSLRRLDLLFSIDYGDDIDKAIRIVTGILADDQRVRSEPPVWVKVVELSPSSVDLRARAWCANGDWWDLRCDTLRKMKQAFDSAGITIPYPHQVTVVKGDPHPEAPARAESVR